MNDVCNEDIQLGNSVYNEMTTPTAGVELPLLHVHCTDISECLNSTPG